jgi:hypothetical protein
MTRIVAALFDWDTVNARSDLDHFSSYDNEISAANRAIARC